MPILVYPLTRRQLQDFSAGSLTMYEAITDHLPPPPAPTGVEPGANQRSIWRSPAPIPAPPPKAGGGEKERFRLGSPLPQLLGEAGAPKAWGRAPGGWGRGTRSRTLTFVLLFLLVCMLPGLTPASASTAADSPEKRLAQIAAALNDGG